MFVRKKKEKNVCLFALQQTNKLLQKFFETRVHINFCVYSFVSHCVYCLLYRVDGARHEETRFVICISNFRACQVRDVLTGAFTTTHCPQSNRPHRPECTQLQFNWRDIFLLCAFGTFLHHLNCNIYIMKFQKAGNISFVPLILLEFQEIGSNNYFFWKGKF